MGIFERLKAAAGGLIPVEDDLDMENSQRVRNMPDPQNPQDAETASSAQSRADSAESSAESYADAEIESHRQGETHATGQPPQRHGNESHSADYITDAPVDSVNGQTGAVTVSGGVSSHISRGVNVSDGSSDSGTLVSGGGILIGTALIRAESDITSGDGGDASVTLNFEDGTSQSFTVEDRGSNSTTTDEIGLERLDSESALSSVDYTVDSDSGGGNKASAEFRGYK